ncbi:MAG: alkaline phosphatase D family protein [Deltaproteobacteria bacterium]|nr:alkaline phosphatase D family protein [Nannocystaceae bacterium]
MPISRRELLRRAGALTIAWPAAAGCGADDAGGDGTEADDSGSSSGTGGDDLPVYEYDGPPGPPDLFQHAVASGDPLTDAVILWSRVTGAPEGAVEAFYEVALDPAFEQRVAADYAQTGPERDYTLKLDVAGLEPGTTYYYRFFALGITSPIGRTKTAATGASTRMRIAVASCSSLAHGYFHAYRRIAERPDLDMVIHLGDYIYEYGSGQYGEVRPYEPAHETIALADYRMRYAQYRRDADLAECHRQHPMIAIWDDHELADNAWSTGAENHSADEGEYDARRAAAYQAYAEWMPFREGAAGVIYRSLAFGELLQLALLDTRIVGRDEQLVSVDDPALDDPERQLLGAAQEAWLAQVFDDTAQWKLLAQQVMVAQLRLGENPLNLDQWDGYPAARTRLFELIRERAPTNLVVLTGDIHSSWAFDLADDPFGDGYDPSTGAGSIAVELVTPSITSPGFPVDSAAQFMASHPHLKWGNLVDNGYVLLDVTPERLQASWWLVADVTSTSGGAESVAAVWSIADGTSHLVEDDAPAPPVESPAPPAP